jgi:hypothetical protein
VNSNWGEGNVFSFPNLLTMYASQHAHHSRTSSGRTCSIELPAFRYPATNTRYSPMRDGIDGRAAELERRLRAYRTDTTGFT